MSTSSPTLAASYPIDNEVEVRLAKASAAFGRLYNKVWNRKRIKLQTKLKVYKAVVVATLLYGSDTWTVYRHHVNKLNHFHTVSLKKLLKIKWQDKIPDTEVLTKADLPSIHSILIKAQLQWVGHVVRMPDYQLPKQLFYGELQTGKRSQAGQKKRFKDSPKASLKAFDINYDSWEQKALDRPQWHSSIFNGSKLYENNRKSSTEQQRLARKSSMLNAANNAGNIPCPNCEKTFHVRIVLLTYLRTHNLRWWKVVVIESDGQHTL